jgi:E3 ubiquitin-protein ligase HUWE1
MLFKTLSELTYLEDEILVHLPITINGEEVVLTAENRMKKLREKANSLVIAKMDPRLRIIADGLNEIVPIGLLRSVVSPTELRNALYGDGYINIEEMMLYVDFKGSRYDQKSIQIKWLFELLRKYRQTERRAFLRFVMGSSQVPAGGFKHLPEKIKILPSPNGPNSLPTASNCFNTLHLPRYLSARELKQKLELDIFHNDGISD